MILSRDDKLHRTSLLHALSEPNRLLIVEQLRDGPLTVGELTDRLQLHQPQVSKHLRVLLDCGVVEVKADANRRIYRLRPDPFQGLHAWLEQYRDVWDETFERLDKYLQEWQSNNDNLKMEE